LRNIRIAEREDWVFESSSPPLGARRRIRIADLIATAVVAVALGGLVVPNASTSAANVRTASTLISEWSKSGTTRTYQENSSRLSYRGSWMTAAHAGYSGGKARSSRQRLAQARFQFTGNAVAWIGPVGPTRGQAKVYLDGRYAKTVDTYASAFRANGVLFKATFRTVKARQLTVVVAGTKGHAMVAIDAIVVRTGQGPAPAQPTTVPVGSGAPETAEPTSLPTPEPSAASTASSIGSTRVV
jgi:hypothetical protein